MSPIIETLLSLRRDLPSGAPQGMFVEVPVCRAWDGDSLVSESRCHLKNSCQRFEPVVRFVPRVRATEAEDAEGICRRPDCAMHLVRKARLGHGR